MSNEAAAREVRKRRHPFTRWSGGMSAVPVFCEEYATIVADPPWRTMAGPLNGREGFGDATGASRPLPYPTMTVDAIKALQVPAANDAHLYLWTTNGYLRDAFDVARAWGFEYSTTLVWAKAAQR